MSQWYLSNGGDPVGPVSHAEALSWCQGNSGAHCWRPGFAEWLPVSQVAELRRNGQSSMPTPPPLTTQAAHDIDFEVFGTEMQFVEVELDPGETAVAEAGAMMYKDGTVEMETICGDGSSQSSQGGLVDQLVGAGKRLVTGEGLFMTAFTNAGHAGKARVAFAAPFPGTIIPVTLSNFGGSLICQKDSFLAAAKGVSIGIHFQRKILTGLFGGEGFIMQKLEGDGLAFLHAGGTVVERELDHDELLHVDTGCLVALVDSVAYDIQKAGGIKSMLFGGEGIFFARLRGPGKVWLQSLPFSRLAGRMHAAAPQQGGSRGEGSVLGAIGNLLDGDNRF